MSIISFSSGLSPAADEQPCRLYATKHLRVLLRASVEFFSSWGMELLVTQLHDHSKAVSMEALDILDEACEDKVRHASLSLKLICVDSYILFNFGSVSCCNL